MKVIADKKDKFGNYPLWFDTQDLSKIHEYLLQKYDGYKFAIIIDATCGEFEPLEKPVPVYFLDQIKPEVDMYTQ